MLNDEQNQASEETQVTEGAFALWWSRSFMPWLKAATTPDGGYLVKAILAIYLNVSLVLWGMLTFDIATLNFGFFKWAFKLGTDFETPDTLILITLAIAGGGLGGVLYGMDKLYKYSVKKQFKLVFIGDYLFRQFGAAALGAIVFALMASGLLDLNLTPDPDSAPPTPVATEAPATPEPVATEAPVATEVPATDEPGATEPPAASSDAATLESGLDDSSGATIPKDESSGEGTEKQEFPFDKKDGFFAFGLGFLSGFGSYQVTKKLDQVIKVIFGQLTNEDIKK